MFPSVRLCDGRLKIKDVIATMQPLAENAARRPLSRGRGDVGSARNKVHDGNWSF